MGSFSIWHWAIVGLVVFLVLPFAAALLIKRPDGPNRFGLEEPFDGRAPDAPVRSVQSGFANAFNFHGRTPRGAFWYVFVPSWLIYTALRMLPASGPLAFLLLALALTALVVWLAVCVRRLHDINRSGWWVLMSFSLGLLILLWWYAQPSSEAQEARRPAMA